jgi:hypothetical protein
MQIPALAQTGGITMQSRNIVTVPYLKTIAPLGKVTVEYFPDKTKQIKAYLLAEQHVRTGIQTGMAIEGSELMKAAFGYSGKLGNLLAKQDNPNLVSLAAQKTGSYLARKVDEDESTTLLYWSTGAQGVEIESIGDLSAYEIEQYNFTGPKHFGASVNLLPAVRYFVERFVQASWGMYVFLTQGMIGDLSEVKNYTTWLSREIAEGRRNPLKLVLIGVGHKIDKSHMELLDNLGAGTPVDLWDYRIASEMKDVLEIFAEVGDANTIVAPAGKVLDAAGHIVVDYSGTGVPALMMFKLPGNAKSFQLELAGQVVVQKIF